MANLSLLSRLFIAARCSSSGRSEFDVNTTRVLSSTAHAVAKRVGDCTAVGIYSVLPTPRRGAVTPTDIICTLFSSFHVPLRAGVCVGQQVREKTRRVERHSSAPEEG